MASFIFPWTLPYLCYTGSGGVLVFKTNTKVTPIPNPWFLPVVLTLHFMRLKPLDILVQGVRMLPILYGVLGLMEHKTRGLEAAGDELVLSFAVTFGENGSSAGAGETRHGEAHLLHTEEPHTPEAPEPNNRTRPRLHLVAQQTGKTVNEEWCRAGTLLEPLSPALRIFLNCIPSVPELSQPREYFV